LHSGFICQRGGSIPRYATKQSGGGIVRNIKVPFKVDAIGRLGYGKATIINPVYRFESCPDYKFLIMKFIGFTKFIYPTKLKFYRNVYGSEIEILKCKSIWIDSDHNFYRCMEHYGRG